MIKKKDGILDVNEFGFSLSTLCDKKKKNNDVQKTFDNLDSLKKNLVEKNKFLSGYGNLK